MRRPRRLAIALAFAILLVVLADAVAWLGSGPLPTPAEAETRMSKAQAAARSAQAATGSGAAREAAVHLAGRIGSRPAASGNEKRAHRFVAKRFRRAGLAVEVRGFAVPGRGRSRNVIGVLDGPGSCLAVLMAHTDSVPEGPGANDNASGVGVLVGLAPRLASLGSRCDVWLVATGAEERGYTATPNHLGASALVKLVGERDLAGRIRLALSLDMVGRGKRFWLRSPQPGPRAEAERRIIRAGKRTGTKVRWVRDSGTGNSDHREFELAGIPAMVLQTWRATANDACYHSPCDRAGRLQAGALRRATRIAGSALVRL